ncbi:anthranilate synthase component I [Cnuibacter physcomitrellae]|uniref:Anthranilate synthase component 1 n=1 Tax=Cnuibacter physcomitrellae TaxID=1619308 RepID=A0A1X9LM83_9MICO|nr:anthranilate synthase component I [Cnuibacter physcomitrellae]ARJ05388.1 anthranilate synthase component I [Cnuibacter physcomitrellae]GGI35595.1 anthranilate synthase component I [Cnuibacter physcomitrellae]
MSSTTTREEFDALRPEHRLIPVIRELFADGETPVGLYRKVADGRPGTFLLESAGQGGVWSRFSFVGASSFGILTEDDGAARWIDLGLSQARAFPSGMPEGPLSALSALYSQWSTPDLEGHPPLTGGLVGFIGWEAVRQLEHLPDAPPADFALPSQGLAFVSELVVVDHQRGTVQLIAAVLNDDPDVDGWDDAQARLDRLQAAVAQPAEARLDEVDMTVVREPERRTRREDFLTAVDEAKEYIRDGDIFQVVISQRFDLECTASPLDVYRVLRTLNPSPYLYLLTMIDASGAGYDIVGSSPEALVKVQSGRAHTHPIAGSRPRGRTVQDDVDLEHELLGDEKEKAEHLMLVDLARNDLLKVCRADSVEVTEFMRVERFSHIMHIVSSVEGELRDGVDAIDVFRATFPAGTLSGAPKPRALEIIDQLEPAQRGLYGGVVGYFGFGGDADLAIAIRTATIRDGVAHVQAGGGLVADSVPQLEFEESQNKAAAPLRAVAVANAMTRVAG